MRRFSYVLVFTIAIGMLAAAGLAQKASTKGPYKILNTARVGGEGGFDYISADVEARRLYIPRSGPTGQLTVFNLDTLEPVGAIPHISAGGATVDPKSHHGFSTTKPITMWDTTTLKVIKTIDVDGGPDGIFFDPYSERVWVVGHRPPYAMVIDAKEGTVVGTPDLGGGLEQGVSDGKGTVYVNVSDNANIAVVDAKTMTVKAHYDISSKCTGGGGLALDAKNHVLFAYCRLPSPMVVIMNADNGKILATLPTGTGVDTVEFNPNTMEAISAENGGSMTFVKENSPTSFVVEEKLQTVAGAKTLVLDTKTNHVLTMTAEYGTPAADAPPGPAGRPAHGAMVPGSFSILMVGK